MGRLKDKIWDAAEAIDTVFGEGYCKKNPELLGRIIQAQAMTTSADVLYDTIHPLVVVASTPTISKTPQ